ncbi:carboxylesterase [Lentithecium fluviatile CBS 122367]|uniref:Carboxylic ester hydrolase n=1 Tax=Lentithecium fluviatile CBS 122367 TaxID=1168545 RepID=A0A6G1JKH7_9PLEO|nr:carboxylesterase [Lentithecium fluviatile CBS 122367]
MRPSFLLYALCIQLTSSRAIVASQAVVTLSSGTVVNGFVDRNYSSVRQFLGLPYAEPPLGDLRWEPPRANKLPATIKATTLGRSCTQFSGKIPTAHNTVVPEHTIADANNTGEDCLTLSVWAPQNAKNLPTIVYFYGGGWYMGGQNTPYQIPTQWVQRTRDLIIVVPNTRGNIFGFPNARGVKDQNLGLLDQRLAVEWVKKNIGVFGGDAKKITIWGQSSGGEAVDLYSIAWHQDPIVSGLIMNSGTALIEDGKGPRYSNFTYVARQVGCGNTTNPADELACMKKIDAAKLEAVLEINFNENGMHHGNGSMGMTLGFGASADNRTYFSSYAEKIRNGQVAKVPAIIGINKEDGNTLAPYNVSGPDESVSEMYFRMVFLCPSYMTSKLRASVGIPTYRYFYSGNFSNISPLTWMGAAHSSELPMLFGTHGNYRGASTPYEIAVSEAMQDAWRAFANNPTSIWQNWPAYTPDHDVMRVFGDNGTVAQNAVDLLKTSEDQCSDSIVW